MLGYFRGAKKGVQSEKEDEDSVAVTKLAIEPETHLEQYLAYYVACTEPGYAVLVTGDWGTGKTHQVTKALPNDYAHYVSLFGLNTPDEIEAQVFSKMFPRQASLKKIADKLSAMTIGIPGYASLGVNGLTSVLANTFIKNEVDNSRPLIFDDLERCSIRNSKILGIINRYVEHHKCRVIVIAHDAKVVEAFKEAKEKVFGQTLMVEPNIDAAFEEFNVFFASQYEEDLLGDLKAEILSTFKESQAKSLRILRHIVEDVRRLVAALEAHHRENRAAMVESIRLFSAHAIEYRTNAFDKSAFKNRKGIVFNYHVGSGRGESPPFVKSAAKYKSVDLSSSLLNDIVLYETLVEGRFVSDHIRDSFNSSAYFLKSAAAAPWQIVGNFDKLDNDLVDPALRRMEEQFANREVTDSGELLQIVSLKMMMASKGVTKDTVRQITDAAKSYVDDLLREKRLPPRTQGQRWFDSFRDAHRNVGYWLADSYRPEFQEILDYLVDARGKALERTFPVQIPSLLEIVRADGHKFFEKVCYTHDGTIEYEDIPILAYIPINDFVDAWLASPKTGWYWIGNALKERCNAANHYPSLKLEATWVPKVVSEMKDRADRESGLAQLRINRAVETVGVLPHLPGQPASAA